MPRIFKMPMTTPQGTVEEIDAYELPYDTVREEWNQYRLPDGRLVRVKVIVSRICQAVDTNGENINTPDGSPLLVVSNRVEIIADI